MQLEKRKRVLDFLSAQGPIQKICETVGVSRATVFQPLPGFLVKLPDFWTQETKIQFEFPQMKNFGQLTSLEMPEMTGLLLSVLQRYITFIP